MREIPALYATLRPLISNAKRTIGAFEILQCVGGSLRAFSSGGAFPLGSSSGGRGASRTLSFQCRSLRAEEEVRQAHHEFEELRRAYDGLRPELGFISHDESGRDRRRNYDDDPGLYAPHYGLLNGDALITAPREVDS